MEKYCPKCNLIKNQSEFNDYQFRRKSGWCRTCCKVSTITVRAVLYIEKLCPKCEIVKAKSFFPSKDFTLKSGWCTLCHNIFRNANRKLRLKSDPVFKMKVRIYSTIRKSLRRKNIKNKPETHEVLKALDYSVADLKQHLEEQFEPWMNWNNHGTYRPKLWKDNDPSTWTWQIDHIIPHSKLNYDSITDQSFRDCWSLKNLRPYSAKQNWIDGVTRKRHNDISR